MSEINFIACDDELEEMTDNSKNCNFTKKSFRAMIKKKKVNVNQLYYPSIRLINSVEVEKYGIKKNIYMRQIIDGKLMLLIHCWSIFQEI